MMKSYVVEMQVYDEVLNCMATIRSHDEHCVEVKLQPLIFDRESWQELSIEVFKCIDQILQQDDDEFAD